MPVQFLTDEERERLNQFPEQIEEEDITAFFTLSASDMKQIHKQRGEQNQLGYAIQLCALRLRQRYSARCEWSPWIPRRLRQSITAT